MDENSLKLGINEALLVVMNQLQTKVSLYAQSEECYECSPWSFGNIAGNKNHSLNVNTSFATDISIRSYKDDTVLCRNSYHFGEGGEYNLLITPSNRNKNTTQCKIEILKDADAEFMPIVWAIVFYSILACVWIFGKILYRYISLRRFDTETLLISDLGSPDETNSVLHMSSSQDVISHQKNNKKRLRSLDTFRGISITIMIFVNYGGGEYFFFDHAAWNGLHVADVVFPCYFLNTDTSTLSLKEPQSPPEKCIHTLSKENSILIAIVLMIFVNFGGGKYWFFHHSPWNGLTIADLVFPWFLWIMGVSITFSIQSLLRRATPKHKIFLKIVKRSAILFLLGLILNTIDKWTFEDIRIMGVLQRFSLTYFLVASMELLFAQVNDPYLVSWWSPISDIILYWPEWCLMLACITAHTLITFLLPVPGCPTGYLGPGGLSHNTSYPNCTGGAAGYIDRQVLGINHMYQSATCKKIYDIEVPYDPEGILGILSSTFLVFLGVQAGKILVVHIGSKGRMVRWLIWSILTGVIGLILCSASENDGFIPLNKNLWSLSYVFVMASMAFFLLTVCYFLVDVQHWWSGAPFFYAGMNSILLYVGHSFTKGVFPWGWTDNIHGTHAEILASNLIGTTLWVLISMWLYHEKFFLAI